MKQNVNQKAHDEQILGASQSYNKKSLNGKNQLTEVYE